jgi:hypothetical protein
MTREEALAYLDNGHLVYSKELADKVCEALGVPLLAGTPMYSDPPGTFKGLAMKTEGEVCVTALDLGAHAAYFYRLDHTEFFGRGSQAREYVRALREHFEKAGVA